MIIRARRVEGLTAMQLRPYSRNETTTAKGHDSRVDQSIEGDVVIRDRGYFGVPARGEDFTMVCRTTDAPLGELDKERIG